MSFSVEFLRPDDGRYAGPFNATIIENLLNRPEFVDCTHGGAGNGSNGGTVVHFPNEETFTLYVFLFEPDLVMANSGIELAPIKV